MKKKEMILKLLLVTIVCCTLYCCDTYNKQQESNLEIIAVKTLPVKKNTLQSYERVSGNVRALKNAALEAKVSGKISSIKVNEGTKVKAGQILISIDAHEIKARLDQALATAQQAEKDLQRISPLLSKGAVTKQIYDATQTRVQVSKAALDEARAMLAYTTIVAPFDGRIIRKFVDEGDLAQPGKVLLSMEGGDGFRFELDVPETLSKAITLGEKIEISLSEDSQRHYGEVSEISPSADLDSRTQHIKINLPQISEIRSGQFGYAYLAVNNEEQIIIPKEAISIKGQLESVFINKDGRAILRLIRTGRQGTGTVQVLSGLNEGELLIIKSKAALTDGMLIEEEK